MAVVAFECEVDEKHGIVEGRELAHRLIMHAYGLLGAYAEGDELAYLRLKAITQHEAQHEIDMEIDSPPRVIISAGDGYELGEEERFTNHAAETAEKTRHLLAMGEAVSGLKGDHFRKKAQRSSS